MKLPNPKLEDELAKEYMKKMMKEDDFYGDWPILRYDDSEELTKNPKPKK